MKRLSLVLVVVLLSGCSIFNGGIEVGKTIWGSSTRALEDARANAITKTYDKGYWEVMRAVEEFCGENYVIFKKDEIKGYLVIMGIKGAVNTTEVGVFIVDVNENQTRIELSSLSTNAKRIVARQLFHGVDITFALVPPDPQELTPIEDGKEEKPR